MDHEHAAFSKVHNQVKYVDGFIQVMFINKLEQVIQGTIGSRSSNPSTREKKITYQNIVIFFLKEMYTYIDLLKYLIFCCFNVLSFLANFTVVSEILISALYNTLMCSNLYIRHQLKEWREQWYWLIDKRINPTCNERQLVRSCLVAWCGSWHSWWNQSWRHSEHWLRNPSTEGSGNVSQNG